MGARSVCGILHGEGFCAPRDEHGCCLPRSHKGPHEFTATDGATYQWETNVMCVCSSCMKCEGDYCSIYWEKRIAVPQPPAADSQEGGAA